MNDFDRIGLKVIINGAKILFAEGMKMLAEERQQIILEMLKTNRIVKVQEICNRTHGSESSVRRDLQALEERGLLERVH